MPASEKSHPDQHGSCQRVRVVTAERTGEPCALDGRGRWLTAPPPARPRRARRHVCRRYVRFRGWGHYEARFALDVKGPLGSVTLGWFDSEWAAFRAAVEFRRRGPSVARYPQILAELVGLGVVPEGTLPKWVYRRPDGRYGARRAGRGGVTHLRGPYRSPEAAFLAMLGRLPAVLSTGWGRHWDEARAIARRYRGGELVRALADEYGVSIMTLYRVLDAVGEPRRPGRPYHGK